MREGGSYVIDPTTGEERLVERTAPQARPEEAPASDDQGQEAEPPGGMPVPVDADGRALRGGRMTKPPLGAPPAADDTSKGD